jgi:AcrR family transcriptional regulator
MARRRDPDVDDAIVRATRDVLVESGYAALTIDGVAVRAGVGRPAIYRRFRSKAELVHTAVFPAVDTVPIPDSGDVEADVRAAVRNVVRLFSRPDVRAAVPGLLAEMYADAALRATLRARIQAPTTKAWQQLLDRAAERGDIKQPADATLLVDVLAGAVMFRLATHGRCGAAFADGLADMLVDALSTPATSRRRDRPAS